MEARPPVHAAAEVTPESALAASLLAEMQDPATVLAKRPVGRPPREQRWDTPGEIEKVSYSHRALADAIIANPHISNAQLGAMFNRTAGWICLVKASDAFKAFYAERYAEIVDPQLTATLQERFKAVTERGLEVLQEKLNRPVNEISDNFVLKAVEMSSKSLGLGGNAPPPPPPNPAEYLPALTERLLRLGAHVRRQPVEDANIIGEN